MVRSGADRPLRSRLASDGRVGDVIALADGRQRPALAQGVAGRSARWGARRSRCRGSPFGPGDKASFAHRRPPSITDVVRLRVTDAIPDVPHQEWQPIGPLVARRAACAARLHLRTAVSARSPWAMGGMRRRGSLYVPRRAHCSRTPVISVDPRVPTTRCAHEGIVANAGDFRNRPCRHSLIMPNLHIEGYPSPNGRALALRQRTHAFMVRRQGGESGECL